MKIRNSKEERKRIRIETMLYGLAQTSTSVSIVVLTQISIAVLTCCRIAVMKCRNISTGKQRNKPANR
jgi:hypothetical protein